MYLYLRSIVLFLHYITLNYTAALCLFYCGCTVRLPYHGIHLLHKCTMGDLCSDYPLKVDRFTTPWHAPWEKWPHWWFQWERTYRQHAVKMSSEERKRHRLNVAKNCDVMEMSAVCLKVVAWMEKNFCLKAKETWTHPCQLMAMADLRIPMSLRERATHRAWVAKAFNLIGPF